MNLQNILPNSPYLSSQSLKIFLQLDCFSLYFVLCHRFGFDKKNQCEEMTQIHPISACHEKIVPCMLYMQHASCGFLLSAAWSTDETFSTCWLGLDGGICINSKGKKEIQRGESESCISAGFLLLYLITDKHQHSCLLHHW